MPFSQTLVPSRDGARALMATGYDGPYNESRRFAVLIGFDLLSDRRGTSNRVAVRFGRSAVKRMNPEVFGISGDAEDALPTIALTRIGDWLDSRSGAEFRPPDEPLDALSDYLRSLADRDPASEPEILRYMGAKSWAAHQFGSRIVEFRDVDRLRLGVETDDFSHVARVYPQHWTSQSQTSPSFTIEPKLIRNCQRGSFPGFPRAPIYQVQAYLQEPRYAAPKRHFEKARDFLVEDHKDRSNALKEAASAVESMLRVMTEKEKDDFSKLIDTIEQTHDLAPALGGTLEKLWGYASDQRGARHAGSTPPEQNESEAVYCLNLAASALLMLRELDRIQRGEV